MQDKSKHEKLKPHYPVLVFRVAALLLCLVLITTYLLSGAYSKFFSGASGGDSARVAHFSPNFTSAMVVDFKNATPGDATEINFTVQNYSGEKMPEVAMKYKILLKTTGNIPLTFTLLDSSENKLLDSPWDCNGTSGECEYEYTDSSLVFSAGRQETDRYKLNIKWPADADLNSAQFSGMTDAVYLSVEFLQID